MAKLKEMFASPRVQAQFVHLDETEVIDGTDTEKYSITIVLDPNKKEDAAFIKTVTELNEAGRLAEVANSKTPAKFKEFGPAKFLRPHFRKNPETEELETTGKQVFTARSGFKPIVYNMDGQKISGADVTGGSEVVVEITASPYSMPSTKKIGATFYVNNVLLIKAGGGRTGLLDMAAKLRDEDSAGGDGSIESRLEKQVG